jgi:hypothetical protein
MSNHAALHQHPRLRQVVAGAALIMAVTACGGSKASPAATTNATAGGSAAVTAPSSDPTTAPPSGTSPAESAPPSSSPEASQEPDTGGGTTSGDVPDNAVFLTYRQASQGFSIQYVEGWQVTTQPDGVRISDKDSSETVAVVAPSTDVAGYIDATDLPALRSQAGFKLVKRDTVSLKGATIDHLVFHALSPADPVTGKQVPSTVDRYYVSGPAHLAIVSLSTPDGVDNVDAFRQMIQSFTWT